MADTEHCCLHAERAVFGHNVSPCLLFPFCSGCSDKMLLLEGLRRSVFNMSGLLAAPLPILCNHRLVLTPCSVRLHTKHVSPLGSGHILPPAVRMRAPTSHHLHPLLLFFLFLVLLQSLLLPITPSFPWPETGDM